MASICVHRATQTSPDSTPRHIRSRDDLQEGHRTDTELPRTAVIARLVPSPTLTCNSSGTAIAIPRTYRAHPPARWHRFVSIERREPLQTALQGTSARAMVFRKSADLPRTAVRARLVHGPYRAHPLARWHRFESIERPEPLQTALQGTSARAMIFRNSADLPHTALRAWLVHGPSLSCNSSGKAIAVLRASRAHPPARWHRFVSIERRQPLQTALQGTSARAMISRKTTGRPRTCHTRPSEPG